MVSTPTASQRGNDTAKPLNCPRITPQWLALLRDKPCLADTDHQIGLPSGLYRRTPDTDALQGSREFRFVEAELDNETVRPVLRQLGTLDTPADYQKIVVRLRADDYYLGLVGELFDFLRADGDTPTEWARLGNALAQFADVARRDELAKFGIEPREILMFAAAAFYFGSYPASACLVLRQSQVPNGSGIERALFDLLARPAQFGSEIALGLTMALSQGNEEALHSILAAAEAGERSALLDGPDTWIPAKLLLQVLTHFMGCKLSGLIQESGVNRRLQNRPMN